MIFAFALGFVVGLVFGLAFLARWRGPAQVTADDLKQYGDNVRLLNAVSR